MDTLKKITPSRFSTLPTLCWTEKGILTSPRIISMVSCFSIWGSYIFQNTIFVTGNPVREHCLLPPRNDPSTVSAHFFQTFQEKYLDLNISLLLCIVPVPHSTIYCCWLDQQGGVVIGVTVLQPEGLGSIPLDSQNPPCWGALQQDMEFLPAAGMQFRLTLAWRGTTQPPHSFRWDPPPLSHKKTVSGSTTLANQTRATQREHCVSTVYVANNVTNDKIASTMKTFQNCIILSQCIINHRAVVWFLISLQAKHSNWAPVLPSYAEIRLQDISTIMSFPNRRGALGMKISVGGHNCSFYPV